MHLPGSKYVGSFKKACTEGHLSKGDASTRIHYFYPLQGGWRHNTLHITYSKPSTWEDPKLPLKSCLFTSNLCSSFCFQLQAASNSNPRPLPASSWDLGSTHLAVLRTRWHDPHNIHTAQTQLGSSGNEVQRKKDYPRQQAHSMCLPVTNIPSPS